MKKIPISEQNQQTKASASARAMPSSAARAPVTGSEPAEPEDPMAGLQADLDRFRDLALRSQADFEN
jgi:hypothetical protein